MAVCADNKTRFVKTITIAKDFSDVPWGRYPADGDFCGENFRERILVPALRAGAKVVVDLDGAEGFGSSFLDEAFGGVVRKGYFTAAEVKQKLEIVTREQEFRMYVDLIWQYIQEASQNLVAA